MTSQVTYRCHNTRDEVVDIASVVTSQHWDVTVDVTSDVTTPGTRLLRSRVMSLVASKSRNEVDDVTKAGPNWGGTKVISDGVPLR